MDNILALAKATDTEVKENTQLIEHERIENTPFTLIKQEDKYFLTLGNYKVTPDYDTKTEALEHMDQQFWTLLMNTIIVINETNEKLRNHGTV